MPLQNPTAERLESDIENIDKITMQSAQILYELEIELTKENFDPQKFEENIKSRFQLDETRTLLLHRAIERFQAAIKHLEEGFDGEKFLASANKLHTDQYEGIKAELDPKRPGVVIVRLRSQADRDIFLKETSSETEDLIKHLKEGGVDIRVALDERKFKGALIPLGRLGIEGENPVLGIIALSYGDIKTIPEKDATMAHEYAHALYGQIIKPFMHHYFSGHGREDWPENLPEEIKTKLLHALGDTSTNFSDETDKDPDDATYEDPAAKISWGELPRLPKKQVTRDHLNRTLQGEQYFLNELRSYGFSNPIRPPNIQMTDLKFETAQMNDDREVVDPKMAKRFFELHLLVLKSYLNSSALHLQVLSILGVSQTLDQAKRLIQELTKNEDWHFENKKRFDYFVGFISEISTGTWSETFQYAIEDQVIIPKPEAIKKLLPSKRVFDEALKNFYPEAIPSVVQNVKNLYQ